MSKLFKGDILHDFKYASSLEWIETNGLGGYASSTVSGAHSRRYHGLLVGAKHPPVGRMVVLSKLDETIIADGENYDLSSNQYPGVIHPQGFRLLVSFQRDLFPQFVYQAGKIRIKKTIAAFPGENTTLILYEVIDSPGKFRMEFLPLCSSRDFHGLSQANDSINPDYLFKEGLFQTRNYANSPELFITIANSQFEPAGHWYHKLEYSEELSRGLAFQEDLFSHGKFVVELNKGDRLGVIISTNNPAGRDPFNLFVEEQKRRKKLVKKYPGREYLQRLALAADQFIVKRGDDLKTIIAGYHWFSDWGRDTMISLPGLCLSMGRYDDARKILQAFAGSVSEGMVPNRFPDYGELPEYNSADASLWFFHAAYQYFEYTNDKKFITALIPTLREIVKWHDRGTRYGIHVESDELLHQGQAGVQLTWMDAKVGNWVVTPRSGKAVEINALWYNSLSELAALLKAIGKQKEAETYRTRALKVKASFNQAFWNDRLGFLYDFIDGDIKNDDLRPNQIYAISLPFQLLPADKAIKVLSVITQQLLTPRGLRSLSPRHPSYRSVYTGDQTSRDGAYHQGIVWSFLLGPYVDAWVRLDGKKGRVKSAHLIANFLKHLDEAGVGTISEIFDAEPPYHPRGCIAQAWGVGEVLRVALQYDLIKRNTSAVAAP